MTEPITKWLAYTDGACAPSNPGPAGWGAVLLPPSGQVVTEHYGFIGPGTNQIAELTAANENTVWTRLRAARRVFQEGVARQRARRVREQS